MSAGGFMTEGSATGVGFDAGGSFDAIFARFSAVVG